MPRQASREIVEKLQELADQQKREAEIYDSLGNQTEARASKFRAANWQEVVDNNRRGSS